MQHEARRGEKSGVIDTSPQEDKRGGVANRRGGAVLSIRSREDVNDETAGLERINRCSTSGQKKGCGAENKIQQKTYFYVLMYNTQALFCLAPQLLGSRNCAVNGEYHTYYHIVSYIIYQEKTGLPRPSTWLSTMYGTYIHTYIVDTSVGRQDCTVTLGTTRSHYIVSLHRKSDIGHLVVSSKVLFVRFSQTTRHLNATYNYCRTSTTSGVGGVAHVAHVD